MNLQSKPKLNTPDVEPSTTLEPNTSITIGAYGTPKSKYFENPTSQIPTDPTIEEVKKEWENDGYTWEEDERFITIYKEHPLDENIVKEILINKCTKNYECYDAADYDNISLPLTLQEHIRLTKTFRAKGWKV